MMLATNALALLEDDPVNDVFELANEDIDGDSDDFGKLNFNG